MTGLRIERVHIDGRAWEEVVGPKGALAVRDPDNHEIMAFVFGEAPEVEAARARLFAVADELASLTAALLRKRPLAEKLGLGPELAMAQAIYEGLPPPQRLHANDCPHWDGGECDC